MYYRRKTTQLYLALTKKVIASPFEIIKLTVIKQHIWIVEFNFTCHTQIGLLPDMLNQENT